MTHWSEGTLVGFDLETTGIDPFNDLPVSYAFVTFEGGKRTETVAALVNPGRPIPSGATKIHGITDERCQAEGQDLDTSLALIADTLRQAAEAGTPIIGMNISYDLTMIDAMLRSRGGTGLADGALFSPVVDCMVLDKHAEQFRKGGRKLSDLCVQYGVIHAGAHDAAADVEASIQVTLAILAKFPEIYDLDVGDLTKEQITWKRQQTASLSEYFVGRGGKAIPEWQHKWPIGRW